MLTNWLRLAVVPLLLVVAAPVSGGPPWITIEYPGNPLDPQTRNAFLVVHAWHHNEAVAIPVSGTAEGLVGDTRRSIPLRFSALSRTGAFALTKQWPDDGRWVLALHVKQAEGEGNTASALVRLNADGSIGSTVVPSKLVEGKWRVPTGVKAKDIDNALRATAEQR